jgi:uncharacterized protein YhbP (UPF0306 family)
MSELELVARFLRSQSTLALGTSAEDGAPRTAALFYLLQDDLRLYWFSSQSSEHSRNLKRNAAAAVSVYRNTADWRKIRGVQMRGAVSVVSARGPRRSIGKLYAERFQLGNLFQWGISRSTLFCFRPSWIRYTDNLKRFGYKFEISLAATNEDRSGSA